MNPKELLFITNKPLIDSTLQGIVRAYETAFPDRVRSYYLIGSYVEGTGVPLSDIDCFVIFADAFTSDEEAAQAEHLGQQCASSSSIRLDIGAYPEDKLEQLHPVIRVALKDGSGLVYGTDIRANIPLPPMPSYTESLTEGARHFIARLRGEMQLTTKTVDYPDTTDRFFGYTQKSIAAWYPPTIDAGTKELVATVSRIASAIVARQAKRYVPGKQAAVAFFQEHVGGEWASFVQQVYQQCKLEWQYCIPEAESDKYQLGSLCQQMLAFENMFLQIDCQTS